MSRTRKAVVAAGSTVLIVAMTALAYYLIVGGGQGEGHKHLGKSEAQFFPLTVGFNDNLTPGTKSHVEITYKNTLGHATDIGHFSQSVVIDPEHAAKGCSASWFRFFDASQPSSENGFKENDPEWREMLEGKRTLPIAAGEEGIMSDGITAAGKWGFDDRIEFIEEPNVNQSACEGAELTIKISVTP